MTEGRLVALGAVTRPHGVLGEVRVHPFNPESELLVTVAQVVLRSPQTERTLAIRSARRHGDVVLMTFEGVRGREAAEALRGLEVCVPREVLPPVGPDEHYHVDLVGLRAVDPGGNDRGVVSDVIRYPSVDCLLVEGATEAWEVPLLEPYVRAVEVAEGRLLVDHLDDLEPVKKRR
ncbi:MAG: 16S rRNA processing protein RimM [Sandaracinaceae bacterium]|nr:16S rRNA processing protein RimM [Sandaracinaceae bacterium]